MEQRIYRLARAGNIDTNPTTFVQRAALFASAATGKGSATLLTRREAISFGHGFDSGTKTDTGAAPIPSPRCCLRHPIPGPDSYGPGFPQLPVTRPWVLPDGSRRELNPAGKINLLTVPAVAAVLLTNACANTPDPGPSPSPPPLGTDTPRPSLAPAEARTTAAAILMAVDVSLHEDFEKGAALTGTTGWVEWWTSGPGFPDRLDEATMNAYSGANQLLSADDEPLSVNDRMDAFSTIAGDAHDWYVSDTGQGYDAALRAKVEARFTVADQQATKVANGK